jgi:DNA-binding NarL/FixJ family response regulator
MAAKPIDMSKLRQVLRLYSQGKSKIFISNYIPLSRNTVKKYIKRFNELKTTLITEIKDKLVKQNSLINRSFNNMKMTGEHKPE